MSEQLRDLYEGLRHADPEQRVAALKALATVDPRLIDSCRPGLVEMASRDPSTDVRYRARQVLAARDRQRVLSAAAEIESLTSDQIVKLLVDPDPQRRLAAIEAARRRRDLLDSDQLADVLTVEADPWVLSSAIAVLGRSGSERHAARIERLLDHPDPRVSANCLEALLALRRDLALPRILPMLAREDNRLKANLMVALYRRYPDQVTGSVRRMLRSERFSIRASGLYCARHLDQEEIGPDVMKLLAREEVEDVFDSALAWFRRAPLTADVERHLEKIARGLHTRESKIRKAIEEMQAIPGLVMRAPSRELVAVSTDRAGDAVPGEPQGRERPGPPAAPARPRPSARVPVRRPTRAPVPLPGRRTRGVKWLKSHPIAATWGGAAALVALAVATHRTEPAPPVIAKPSPVAASPQSSLPRVQAVIMAVPADGSHLEVSAMGQRFLLELPPGAPPDLARGRAVVLSDVRFVNDGEGPPRLVVRSLELPPP